VTPTARLAPLSRIQRYVLAHALKGIAAAAALLSGVVVLINFVDLSRMLAGRTEAGFLTDLGLTLLKSPSVILQLFPFVFLFGVLGAFINLNRRSELVAIRAAGVSAWRFILPAAAAALVLGVATLALLNPMAAIMNSAFEHSRDALNADTVTAASARRIWLRQGDERSQVIIGAAARTGVGGVSLKDATFFVYRVSPQGAPAFAYRIEAAQARLMHGYWRLTDAKEAAPGGRAVRHSWINLPSNLDDRTALERYASPQSISFWTLPNAVARIEDSGFSAVTYRLRLQQLLASPVLFMAMAVLAAAFSLKLSRLGGLALLAASGVACGFGVFFFSQLCDSLAKAGVLPPFAAAWAPPVLALLSACTMLLKSEDG
jgi:lipopolysaccharide export system permease protein